MERTATPVGNDTSYVETRSIDYVPLNERQGGLLDQTTIWFAGSAHIMTLFTGAIGISLGLNLGWTLIALAIGTFLGTIPVSAHATQGPHLGLPQMIQSRPQFGRYGALVIWVMAIIVYWGYLVLGGNLLGSATAMLVAGPPPFWAAVSIIIAMLLAIFGYNWLHVAQRYITFSLVIAVLAYIIGLAVTGAISGELFDLSQTFDTISFMIVVVAATGYQLTWAFFVSDYSRYMPPTVSKFSIIAATSTGLYFGLFSFMAIGAIAASLIPSEGMFSGLLITGDHVFPGLGSILMIVGILGLLGLMGMCAYGGSLTLITTMDSIKPVSPTRRVRIITLLIIGFSGLAAAVLVSSEFMNEYFATVLIIVGYFMAPWTAINLTDFFVVRRGQYSITEMFRVKGIYGFWNWRGISTYIITLVIMTFFMNVDAWQGVVAKMLGGVDIAFFVGIPVGCILYWLLCRRQDFTEEREALRHADTDINEADAKPIV